MCGAALGIAGRFKEVEEDQFSSQVCAHRLWSPFMVVRGAHTVLRPAVGCADRHRAPRPQLSEVHRYLAKDMVKKLASFLAAEVQRPITETVEQARTVRQEIKVRRLSLPFTDLSLPFNAFH